jgi:hypothetical protein
MRTLMAAQIDPLTRTGDPGEQGGRQILFGADEREHRAVVVDIRVHVEQRPMLAQGASDRVDRFAVSPLREVRHGFERKCHARTLGA